MTITTRLNVGDIGYYIESNTIKSGHISEITITISVIAGSEKEITISYAINNVRKFDSEVFETPKDLALGLLKKFDESQE